MLPAGIKTTKDIVDKNGFQSGVKPAKTPIAITSGCCDFKRCLEFPFDQNEAYVC